jgi:hypothetical protein
VSKALSAPALFHGEIVCEPRYATWFEPEAYQRSGVWVIFDNTALGYAYQNALALMGIVF